MGQIISKRISKGWVQLDRSVMRDTRIKSTQKLIYALFCSMSETMDNVYPTYSWIAQEVGYEAKNIKFESKENKEKATRKWVLENLQPLIDLGWIKQVQKHNHQGYDYEVYDHDCKTEHGTFRFPGTEPLGSKSTEPLGSLSNKEYSNKDIVVAQQMLTTDFLEKKGWKENEIVKEQNKCISKFKIKGNKKASIITFWQSWCANLQEKIQKLPANQQTYLIDPKEFLNYNKFLEHIAKLEKEGILAKWGERDYAEAQKIWDNPPISIFKQFKNKMAG